MNIQELTHSIIKKETDSLREKGLIDNNYRVLQCLIKLPPNSEPIVEFNDKIKWIMQSNTAHMKENQAVYIWDIKKIKNVEFPKYKGLKVAYIFFYYSGFDYSIIFDFSPNSVQQDQISDFNHPYSKTLTDYYNLYFTELIIKQIDEKTRRKLIENNYFITPSITPYPINIILNPKKNINDFINELVAFFDSDILSSIKTNWFNNKTFESRKKLFEEAIENYENQKYLSCISILIPQIEGILREFLFLKESKATKTNSSKAFDRVKELFESKKKIQVVKVIMDSFSEFFNNRNGFFESFNNWTDSLSSSFISRHAYSHGKYDEDMYNKENCVRLFLMLYTFYDMINLIEK